MRPSVQQLRLSRDMIRNISLSICKSAHKNAAISFRVQSHDHHWKPSRISHADCFLFSIHEKWMTELTSVDCLLDASGITVAHGFQFYDHLKVHHHFHGHWALHIASHVYMHANWIPKLHANSDLYGACCVGPLHFVKSCSYTDNNSNNLMTQDHSPKFHFHLLSGCHFMPDHAHRYCKYFQAKQVIICTYPTKDCGEHQLVSHFNWDIACYVSNHTRSLAWYTRRSISSSVS